MNRLMTPLAKRCLVLAAFSLLPLSAAAGEETRAPIAPALRQNVVVTGDLVRIGDLIDNAGAAADIAIFRAPDLGTTGSVPAARIVQMVRAHDVFAVDTKGLTDISVTRAGLTLGMRDFENRIAAAIASQYRVGEAENLGITFDREVPVVQAEPEFEKSLVVTRLSFDPRSGRFDATLDLPGSRAFRRGGLRLTGIAAETQQVAVVKRSIARGETLRAGDIAIERRPKTDLSAEIIADANAAIGMSARNPLRGGQALRRADLQKPELVERNQPVVLIFEAPGMTLTMRGTATEAGTEGDVVHVTNLQSKRTVQGIVTGPGRVTVSTMKPRVTASLAPAPYQTGLVRRNVQ
ncbi:MAG: flagellar basal body P-ring biosynthesis protein FlgA [Alphaproteobacteria bacterium]|nr:MAG: flagellar basal body P-ring biosynthesis protein FlgA [Alphaproteobacteria bacterium]